MRDRRVRQRQVDADPGRAVSRAREGEGQGHGDSRRLRPPLRRGLDRRHRVRGPVADRQDHAQQSGQLRRRVRQHPRDLREGEDVEGAQLHRRHLLLQLGRRPLPDLRRQRLRARRDAVPVRRLPALPGLRRHALPAGNAGGDGRAPRQAGERRRRARHDGQRGARVLRRGSRSRARAGAARRRRPRVRETRTAGPDAVGRRGAAPEARRLPRRGGERQAADPRHAVPVRRAHDRPALRRRRQADARLPQAARRRALARDHRAQHGRGVGVRLADRPRPGRRRRRRRSRGRRHAGRPDPPRALAHGARTEGVPGRAGAPGAARQRGGNKVSVADCRRRPERGTRHGEGGRPCPRVDSHSECARAQPEVDQRRDPARDLHGDHRGLGVGQVDAGVRHPLQRRPAALPRVAERVRALHRPARRPPGRRRDPRHPADGGDRAAHLARRAQVDGGDADRALPLPAPAVREARRAALPRLQRCR